MVEICTVGGYNEVGKNSTAVKVGDEVYVFDLGVHLENYIKFTQDDEEDILQLNPKDLIKAGAVPNIDAIYDWKDKIKMLLPTHAHLDHIGAIP